MRKPDRLNDYVTRKEAYALVVHVVNEVLSRLAKDERPETVPTDSEGAEA